MKIMIMMDLADELADPGHPMGITEEGHNDLCDALGEFGTDIEISRVLDGE